MKWVYNTLTAPCGKSKMISFDSLIIKNFVVFQDRSRFPVKLICCIGFGSASSACCFLKFVAIILKYFLE